MKRKKIHFQKLLNLGGGYGVEIQLEVLNWMLKTGQGYTKRTGMWYVDGVDKQIFNYSANNHDSRTAIDLDMMRLYFLNGIIAEAGDIIEQWREASNIKLNNYIWLWHSDELPPYQNQRDAAYWTFKKLSSLTGKKLKKEFFHPEYADRTQPYIKSAKFASVGNGLEFHFDFTFIEYPDSGWSYGIPSFQQGKEESIEIFIRRVEISMNNLMI